jgi:membrane dipeptidase
MRRPLRPIPVLVLVAIALVAPGSVAAQETWSPPDAASLERAREILERHPVFDGHNDVVWEIRAQKAAPRDVDAYDLSGRAPGQTDLARLRKGGVGAQFWSVYVPGEYADSGFARVQLEEIDIALRMIEKYPELVLARTADEVEAAMRDGKIASLLGVEGGHAIENSMGALRVYHRLGVRYMTLTHNVTLDWVDAAMDEARHGGLTRFGEEVVREMNRLGMLVDLSHVSPGAMSDVLNVTEAPVIFSHSSARALTDVPRNVPDSILARMPENGGVVMVTFVPAFVNEAEADWSRRVELARDSLIAAGGDREQWRAVFERFVEENPRPLATLSDVADHIDHVREVAGIDHVGIGSDFDVIGTPPSGLEDVSAYPNLAAELLRRGWSEDEIGKLTSGNVLRAMRDAEAVARRLLGERSPSTAVPDEPGETGT